MARIACGAAGGTNTSAPPADLARFRADQHLAPAFHDDIYLLVRRVGVQSLLAAGLAFHPGDAELT